MKNIVYRRSNALWRMVLLRILSRYIPQVVIAEYPKSGGSWFGQMMSEALGKPFPRNKIPSPSSNILQGHYLYHKSLRNAFCVVRDGRDVMVSFYFYCFFENDKFNAPLVSRYKNALRFSDYRNIRDNMPTFLKFQLTTPLYPRFTWPGFIDSWLPREAYFIRYEDLLAKPVKSISDACTYLGESVEEFRIRELVDRYSFKAQSGREPGQENISSFLRKGIKGDWVNHFNREAREIFEKYAGETLRKLSYEIGDQWVNGS